MLTFLVGLSLGACIGAAALGVCRAGYEREMDEDRGIGELAPESRL